MFSAGAEYRVLSYCADLTDADSVPVPFGIVGLVPTRFGFWALQPFQTHDWLTNEMLASIPLIICEAFASRKSGVLEVLEEVAKFYGRSNIGFSVPRHISILFDPSSVVITGQILAIYRGVVSSELQPGVGILPLRADWLNPD